jgi:hypothetical protein
VAEGELSTEQVVAMLAEAPVRIAALAAGHESTRLHAAPDEGGWSANEVLAHLRACADVWGGCIARIVVEDAPTIRAMNPRHWIKSTDYVDQQFAPSLRAFTSQRADLLAALQALQPQDWSRSATITGAGKPLTRTVRSYAEWMARHERPHLRQIKRLVGRD